MSETEFTALYDAAVIWNTYNEGDAKASEIVGQSPEQDKRVIAWLEHPTVSDLGAFDCHCLLSALRESLFTTAFELAELYITKRNCMCDDWFGELIESRIITDIKDGDGYYLSLEAFEAILVRFQDENDDYDEEADFLSERIRWSEDTEWIAENADNTYSLVDWLKLVKLEKLANQK